MVLEGASESDRNEERQVGQPLVGRVHWVGAPKDVGRWHSRERTRDRFISQKCWPWKSLMMVASTVDAMLIEGTVTSAPT